MRSRTTGSSRCAPPPLPGGKKITDSAITGDAGIAFIHTIVGKRRHVWREWNGSLDAGVDGSIELRDPLTGEVANKRLQVQSKAWTVPFAGEDDTKFHRVCDDRDIDYCMKADDPVILVCSPHRQLDWLGRSGCPSRRRRCS